MNRKNIISDLKSSTQSLGKLYPILLDKEGNILDGFHRSKADADWPKYRLDHITTEEERLIVKLVANVCRRSVTSAEKKAILGRLAQIFLEEGIKPGQIPYVIAQKTGMSYRWVMTYLPSTMKKFPGRGGPSKKYTKLKFDGYPTKSRVADPATVFRELFYSSPSSVISIMNYKNTKFVNILLDRTLYSKIETASNNLGIHPQAIIENAIFFALKYLTMYGYEKHIEEQKSTPVMI